MRALLLAFRDHLMESSNSGLSLTEDHCDISDDGKPEPACGQYFVSVHPGSWSGEDIEGLAEKLTISVTITVRSTSRHGDRERIALVGTSDRNESEESRQSLYALAEAVRAACHLDVGSDRIMNLANSYILGNGVSVNGMVEPPRFRGADGRPVKRGPDWFGSVGSDPPESGYSLTLNFDSTGRYQTIESMA